MRPFEFRSTDSVEGAIAMSGQGVRFVAGGTTLIDLMKLEVETPEQVVDIHRLPLSAIEETEDGGVRIGAMATNSAISYHATIRNRYPLLADAVLAGASPQLRNMATAGGNLLQRTRCTYFRDTFWACNKRQPGSGCSAMEGLHRNHAFLGTSDQCFATHPSDMAVALMALDAVVKLQSAGSMRKVGIGDFHVEPGATPHIETVVHPGELITGIELAPLKGEWRSQYLKVRDRESYEFAVVSVAAMLRMQGRTIEEARIAFGGVATKPWRSLEAEQVLNGAETGTDVFERAAERATAGAAPRRDNRFKVELLKRTLVRTLEDLTEATA